MKRTPSKRSRRNESTRPTTAQLCAIDPSFQCEPVRENDCVIEIVESDKLNRLYRPFRKFTKSPFKTPMNMKACGVVR